MDVRVFVFVFLLQWINLCFLIGIFLFLAENELKKHNTRVMLAFRHFFITEGLILMIEQIIRAFLTHFIH